VTAGLPASVHFANASTALSAEDRAAVHAAAEGVRAGGGALALTGYTDNTGSLERNQALAKSRAQAVRAALIADGVPAERIVLTPPASVEVGASADSDPDARRVDIAQRQAP
jgi:cytochrome c oxidase subunit 2